MRHRLVLTVAAHARLTTESTYLDSLWHRCQLTATVKFLSFLRDPLAKLNKLKHEFGILCNLFSIKSLVIQQNVQVATGVNSAESILLEELQCLLGQGEVALLSLYFVCGVVLDSLAQLLD